MVAAAIGLAAACGPHCPLRAPQLAAGQIPADYRLQPARALILARIDVTTDGKSGFGPIINPLYLELERGDGARMEQMEDLRIADPRDRFFTSEAHRPALWQYAQPGLLAMSVSPGTYDAMAIGYPDVSRPDRPAESIPDPDRPMLFAPVRIAPDTVVYIGDVEIAQTIGWADLLRDRITVRYAVVDRYDQAVADFRARYPQFQNAAIEKRLVEPRAISD